MFFLTDLVNPLIPLLPNQDPNFINSLLMINYSSVLSFIIFIAGYWYLQHLNFNAEKRIYALLEETNIQKHEIETIHKTLTDSIHYAKGIQNAVLPKHDILKQYCTDYFLLYKPKDIISGDFYNIQVYYNQLIIAVADCTGHGIPGALMSMLGMSFLNQTLSKTGLKKTDETLNTLRTHIKTALKQSDFDSKTKDGIDMSIVIIDLDTLKAQYSGANRPILHIAASDTKTITELKPDKFPVGIYTRESNFSLHEFQLTKGDTLYLYTDGYEDQFGADHISKFKTKRFKEQILKIQSQSMSQQQTFIDDLHNSWKGKEPQTDDILILGIRV